MATRTSGRWHLCRPYTAEDGYGFWPIRARNGSLVAEIVTHKSPEQCVRRAVPSAKKAKVNAIFIVRACNAHDDLVAALKECEAFLWADLKSRKWSEAESGEIGAAGEGMIKELHEKVEAALAKASA